MKRPSTGWRSTTNHFHGHCADIAEQHNARWGTNYTTEGMKRRILLDLYELDAWPGEIRYTRRGTAYIETKGWSEADAAMANAAVDYCHALADTEGYFLHEYNELGVAEKVWYGRRKE